MKIKFIFILFFFSFLTYSYTQDLSWELTDNSGAVFTSIIEDDQGNIIAAIHNNRADDTKIIKLDKFGNQILEKYIYNDSLIYNIQRIVYISSTNRYLLIGHSYIWNADKEFYKRYLVAVEMDSELNIGATTIKHLDLKGSIEYMDYFLTENEDVLVSVYVYTLGELSDKEHVFVKLNKSGEFDQVFIEKGSFECYSIVKSGDRYQCLGRQIRNFDTQFNYIDTESINLFFKNPSRIIRINDNKLLMGFVGNLHGETFGDGVLYYLDNDLNIIKKNWTKTGTGVSTANNIFDLSPDSSIFMSTLEPFDSYFHVGKFDVNLNQLWQIKIENIGNFYYKLWGMEATNDNGVILYGTTRLWTNYQYSLAYMIKIDSEGKIVSTYNIPQEDLVSIKTFPNPISKEVTLEINGITGEAEVRVFDMAGRNLYVQHGIMNGSNTVDLSGLSSGTYIYKLYQGRKEISSGQWVKM